MSAHLTPSTERTEPTPERHGIIRRWRWAVPALLLVAWLAVGGIGGPYSGKLAEVQKNDNSSFLPKTAESSRVAQLQKQFTTTTTFPAFLLVESTKTLTPQQFAAVKGFADSIPAIDLPVEGYPSVKVGDYLAEGPVSVIPSEDGKAALALVNFNIKDITSTLQDGKSPIQRAVEVIRDKDGTLERDGATAYVAGPAATIADLIKAFGGIDGILLLVAGISVLLILLVVYRSPVIPILVLMTAGLALTFASLVVYFLAKNDVITLDGQGQGILSILVVGSATDYALLLVARYREELRNHEDRYEAMWLAWRRTLEPVAASAGTVMLGLMCLLLSNLGPTKGLGPVGAVGIACSLLAALTFLPAILVVPGLNRPGEHGRWIFWPAIPHLGSQGPETRGLWAWVARLVGGHPRRVWIGTGIVLLALAAFLPTLKAEGIKTSDTFLTTVESVTGGDELVKHFPGGSGSPTIVIGPESKIAAMTSTIKGTAGVAAVLPTTDAPAGAPSPDAAPKVAGGAVKLQVTLTDPADSPAADQTVRRLRTALDSVGGDVLVGGSTAQNLDVRDISAADRNRIIPVILLVIFIVLALLLRALVAPLVLIVANVLSFAATLGASALIFNHVFHFPGSDPTVGLYGFVFLVALGIDYSIFLMTRVREESIRQGTRPGILTGLAVTGGVITSAGIVLASTFAALGVLPLLFLAQIAFIVAFGVLLDTLVVRSLLVPALSYDIGRRIWAPSRLGHGGDADDHGPASGRGGRGSDPDPVLADR
ncbi:MAG TPA: MMPL family transporter [Kineosporiaceae bacterium]|nr:MMPL family transporter [Kineosporiaceae bacterium]